MTENALAAIIILSLGACLGLLFIGGGIFMIYLGRQSQKKADASQNWPSVNGTIQDVKAAKNFHTGADDDINVETYSPKLRYSYTVAGTEYSSDRIAFGYGKTFNSESAALASIQKHSQGSMVTVFYNPENPNEAVLERKNERQIWGLAGGILLIVLGLCSSCSMILTGVFLGTG
jgi:hypothetical protein